MHHIKSAQIQCPHCKSGIELRVDCSIRHQELFEDCSACEKLITISIAASDGELTKIKGFAQRKVRH